MLKFSKKNNIKLKFITLYTDKNTFIKRIKKSKRSNHINERLGRLTSDWKKYFKIFKDKNYENISKIMIYAGDKYNYEFKNFNKNTILKLCK